MSREMAVQMLFQTDLAGSSVASALAGFDLADFLLESSDAGERPESRPDLDEAMSAFGHARELVEGTAEHLEEIDSLIRAQAENWRLERMPAVDRNILRLAVYEMLFQADVPKLVVVDEAVELAKRFGSEQSSRFVNGLLDGLIRRHDFPGSLK